MNSELPARNYSSVFEMGQLLIIFLSVVSSRKVKAGVLGYYPYMSYKHTKKGYNDACLYIKYLFELSDVAYIILNSIDPTHPIDNVIVKSGVCARTAAFHDSNIFIIIIIGYYYYDYIFLFLYII